MPSRKPNRNSRKNIKRKQKSIGKSPNRIIRSKRITRSKNRKNKIKIKSRFGEGDEHGAGAEEKKEDIPYVHSPEDEYVEFYRNLRYEDSVLDDLGWRFKDFYDSNDLLTFNILRNIITGRCGLGYSRPILNEVLALKVNEKIILGGRFTDTDICLDPFTSEIIYEDMLEGMLYPKLEGNNEKDAKVEDVEIVAPLPSQQPAARRKKKEITFIPPPPPPTHVFMFLFTNYGKLIRQRIGSGPSAFFVYDSNTLLHPEAFEIMKKLWKLDLNRNPILGALYNYNRQLKLRYSDIIDFFKNIVDISNTLRDKDMKLYELKKEIDKCEKERIQEMETMLRNYENIRDQDFPH